MEHALITRFGTLGRKPAEFLPRSDNGLVFASRKFTALVRSYGLKQEFITPHSPWASDQWRLHGSSHSRTAWSSASSAPSRSHAFTAIASRASNTPRASSPTGSASTITAVLIRPLPCERLPRHSLQQLYLCRYRYVDTAARDTGLAMAGRRILFCIWNCCRRDFGLA